MQLGSWQKLDRRSIGRLAARQMEGPCLEGTRDNVDESQTSRSLLGVMLARVAMRLFELHACKAASDVVLETIRSDAASGWAREWKSACMRSFWMPELEREATHVF